MHRTFRRSTPVHAAPNKLVDYRSFTDQSFADNKHRTLITGT
jgi:hypothetical protein